MANKMKLTLDFELIAEVGIVMVTMTVTMLTVTMLTATVTMLSPGRSSQ